MATTPPTPSLSERVILEILKRLAPRLDYLLIFALSLLAAGTGTSVILASLTDPGLGNKLIGIALFAFGFVSALLVIFRSPNLPKEASPPSTEPSVSSDKTLPGAEAAPVEPPARVVTILALIVLCLGAAVFLSSQFTNRRSLLALRAQVTAADSTARQLMADKRILADSAATLAHRIVIGSGTQEEHGCVTTGRTRQCWGRLGYISVTDGGRSPVDTSLLFVQPFALPPQLAVGIETHNSAGEALIQYAVTSHTATSTGFRVTANEVHNAVYRRDVTIVYIAKGAVP